MGEPRSGAADGNLAAQALRVEVERGLALAVKEQVGFNLHVVLPVQGLRAMLPPKAPAGLVTPAHQNSAMLDINLLRKTSTPWSLRWRSASRPRRFWMWPRSKRWRLSARPQTRTEELQAQRNSLSKQIGQLKGQGESADAVMAQVAALKGELDHRAARSNSCSPNCRPCCWPCPTCRTAACRWAPTSRATRKCVPGASPGV